MSIFYKSLLTFPYHCLDNRYSLVFSQVGPQPQKSVLGKFFFAVVLFIHLHRRVEQLPEKIKKII